MRRALIGITGLALTACGAHIVSSYDVAKVQADFIACMNASPAPDSPVGLDNKISACQSAAWASARRVR